MTKVWVDPPEGWRYGFPKIWDSVEHPNMLTWLHWAGYPEYVREAYGKYFYCRQWAVEDQDGKV